MGGETYTLREDSFPYFLPGARGCQRLHPFASSSDTPRLCIPRSTAILRILSKSAWFPSRDLLPVTHLFDLSALIRLSCLLITTWQLVKAHRVSRNKPKIHDICYITPCLLVCNLGSLLFEGFIRLFSVTFLFPSFCYFLFVSKLPFAVNGCCN